MDAFTGEIRAFGCNFAPQGWAQCLGQIMSIQQYTALFSLLGTTYGGNGTTTFALPNLQGSVPVGAGQSTSGTVYQRGQVGGSAAVTLNSTQMPAHNHIFNAASVLPNSNEVSNPANNTYLSNAVSNTGGTIGPGRAFVPQATQPISQLNPQAIGVAGGNQPHNNMMPYQAINYCICLSGEWPQRP